MDRTGPDLFDALRRYWVTVALMAALGACLSGLLSLAVQGPPGYAVGTVGLTSPSTGNVIAPGVQGDASLARYTSQRALFMKSDPVLSRAVQQVPKTTVGSLRRALTIRPSSTSTSVMIEAEADTAEDAVARVEAVISAYRQETRTQVAARTKAALDSLAASERLLRESLASRPDQPVGQSSAAALAELTRTASALQADSAVFADGVDFVEAPGAESSGTRGLPLRQLALGALVGLALGSTLAWLRADRDPQITRPDQVESVLGAPQLGVIPLSDTRLTNTMATAGVVRQSRDLVTPLLATGVPPVLLVTGSGAPRACASLALGLTAALAVEGLRPLLVDADPAARRVSRAVGIKDGALGLVDFLAKAEGDPTKVALETEVSAGVRAAVMSPGRAATGDRLTASAVSGGMVRLRSVYDVVVMTGPVLGTDALPAAVWRAVEGVIVVVRSGTEVNALLDLRHVLELSGVRVLGYVYDGTGPRQKQVIRLAI